MMEEEGGNLKDTEGKSHVVKNPSLRPEHIEKLKEEHQKAHSACLQKTEELKKFKKDYEILKSRLETFPDNISYDVMVPFGSLAFMPGQLVHTNEILALLGVNWFAEVSAKQASEIAGRRIKKCEKMLEDLEKEMEQYENWLKYIDEVTGGELVEVIEHCSEESLNEWREQHAKNVKAYKQKKVDLNSSSPEVKNEDSKTAANESSIEPEKDYFQILENHLVEETVKNEMTDDASEEDNEKDEGDDDILDDIHEISSEEEQSEEEDNEEEEEEDHDEEDGSSDEHSKSNGKHVKWIDQEGEKMKNRITFTHSSRKCKSHASSKPVNISKSKAKSKDPSSPLSPVKILSPSDIYKCFSTKPEQPKPKSILKRTSSVDETTTQTELVNVPESEENVEDVPVLKPKFREQTAFTGEIVECVISKENLDEKIQSSVQRAPSRFKAQRQTKHR